MVQRSSNTPPIQNINLQLNTNNNTIPTVSIAQLQDVCLNIKHYSQLNPSSANEIHNLISNIQNTTTQSLTVEQVPIHEAQLICWQVAFQHFNPHGLLPLNLDELKNFVTNVLSPNNCPIIQSLNDNIFEYVNIKLQHGDIFTDINFNNNLNWIDQVELRLNFWIGQNPNETASRIAVKNYIMECFTSLKANIQINSENTPECVDISSFPKGIFVCASHVQEVQINDTKISTLDKDTFIGLKNIYLLDVGKNQLNELPHDIFAPLIKLKIISISMNQLKEIPQHLFWNNTQLIELMMGYNKISRLYPNTFANLTLLNKLKLNNNQLNSIASDTFAGLEHLTVLNLSHNLFKNILHFDDFKNLPQLTCLYLNNNYITYTIPPINNNILENLQVLNLSNNRFSTIVARTFPRLPNLQSLILNNNAIYYIGDNSFLSQTNLKMLDMSSNNLTNIERHYFTGLINLEKLLLQDNKIDTISVDAFNHLNLGFLSLENNKISEFPRLNMNKLTALDVSNSRISKLSTENFIGITNLKDLYISGTQIEEIQNNTFSHLIHLKILFLSNKKLAQIHPYGFEGLQQLETLVLSNTIITQLPDLSRLENLNNLTLDNTPITLVNLRQMPQLKTLQIENMRSPVTIITTTRSELKNLFWHNTVINNLIELAIESLALCNITINEQILLDYLNINDDNEANYLDIIILILATMGNNDANNFIKSIHHDAILEKFTMRIKDLKINFIINTRPQFIKIVNLISRFLNHNNPNIQMIELIGHLLIMAKPNSYTPEYFNQLTQAAFEKSCIYTNKISTQQLQEELFNAIIQIGIELSDNNKSIILELVKNKADGKLKQDVNSWLTRIFTTFLENNPILAQLNLSNNPINVQELLSISLTNINKKVLLQRWIFNKIPSLNQLALDYSNLDNNITSTQRDKLPELLITSIRENQQSILDIISNSTGSKRITEIKTLLCKIVLGHMPELMEIMNQSYASLEQAYLIQQYPLLQNLEQSQKESFAEVFNHHIECWPSNLEDLFATTLRTSVTKLDRELMHRLPAYYTSIYMTNTLLVRTPSNIFNLTQSRVPNEDPRMQYALNLMTSYFNYTQIDPSQDNRTTCNLVCVRDIRNDRICFVVLPSSTAILEDKTQPLSKFKLLHFINEGTIENNLINETLTPHLNYLTGSDKFLNNLKLKTTTIGFITQEVVDLFFKTIESLTKVQIESSFNEKIQKMIITILESCFGMAGQSSMDIRLRRQFAEVSKDIEHQAGGIAMRLRSACSESAELFRRERNNPQKIIALLNDFNTALVNNDSQVIRDIDKTVNNILNGKLSNNINQFAIDNSDTYLLLGIVFAVTSSTSGLGWHFDTHINGTFHDDNYSNTLSRILSAVCLARFATLARHNLTENQLAFTVCHVWELGFNGACSATLAALIVDTSSPLFAKVIKLKQFVESELL